MVVLEKYAKQNLYYQVRKNIAKAQTNETHSLFYCAVMQVGISRSNQC